MSAPLVLAVLALGLGVIVVRRRSTATALIAAQSLVLGAGALELASGRGEEYLIASLVLLIKALVLPALLYVMIRRTREARLVAPVAPALVRLAGAGAVALLAAALVPPLGLGDPRTEHASVALVLVGVTIVVARRPTFLQVLGLIVAENGLSMLAISVQGGVPYAIELGVVFDLVLVVTVALAFAQRIHTELGTSNTELLRALRD
jgi:hydrogenase-4 membrane subunit HyfE